MKNYAGGYSALAAAVIDMAIKDCKDVKYDAFVFLSSSYCENLCFLAGVDFDLIKEMAQKQREKYMKKIRRHDSTRKTV